MQIQSNPIKTWVVEEGEVRVFHDKENFTFDIKSKYEIEEIALEHIEGLAKEVFMTKHDKVETISGLFEKVYPKIVDLEDGSHSLKFIDNCFAGMNISVQLLKRTIVSEEDEEFMGFPEETLTLSVNPNDTVGEIKEKFRKIAEISSNESLVLIYKNEPLKNSATLVNCEISEGITLKQAEKGIRENRKISFLFNGLQEKQEVNFAMTAPLYRLVGRGLNMKGKCIKKGCEAENKFVWIQKGMGTFETGEHAYTSVCPMCKETAEDVNNVGFWNCIYSIEGFQLLPEKKKIDLKDQIAGSEKFTTFEEKADLAKWTYLRITTKPKN